MLFLKIKYNNIGNEKSLRGFVEDFILEFLMSYDFHF